MNQEIKKKWLNALRSGDYKQGRDVLRRVGRDGEDRWCCLGVLCDIIDKKGWDKTPSTNSTNTTAPTYLYKTGIGRQYHEAECSVPESVAKLAGIDNVFVDCENGDRTVRAHLESMNDVKKYSFKKIADWIEENL